MERAALLEREATAEGLWAGAIESFAAAGFPHVIYILTNAERSTVDLRTNIPQIYETADPARDPFLEYCCASYEATRTGVGYLQTHDYLPEEARALILAAEKVGFRTGFGIPTRLDGSPRFGGFNIGTPLDRKRFEAEMFDQLADIRGFCLLLHRRFEELSHTDADGFSLLTPREREIIELIGTGDSRKECARKLDLSPNTVADYTKSAYRKLGVRNRAEAAQKLFGKRRG
ncbi:helix-turn-helix transcriptional regulator [Aliiruegeria sabulilitoris]|uniref:helix-turn-helix transcriptional regulator n=1 Tax=Aliiruegeria sabulilitoris TaxID=1510458 RepID=UPI0008313DB4|nr:LuxR family transcriptional regulator [Aliiruegeria sabulilitoris]